MRRSWFAAAAVLASLSAQAAPHGMYLTPEGLARFPQLQQDLARTGGVMEYFGGPVISKVNVVVVLWGPHVNAQVASGIGPFFAAAVNSTWFDILAQYKTDITGVNGHPGTNQTISRGGYSSTVEITPTTTSTHLTDRRIQIELVKQIAAGKLPKPDANTLYMTYFAPGVVITLDGMTSCSTFGAYHEGFTSTTYGSIAYGVMPDCGYGFQGETSVSSHELAEATSDYFPTPGSHPAYPQAWNSSNGSEIGDLCEGSNGSLKVSGGTTYSVQQIYSNAAGGCSRGNYTSP